MSLQQAALEKKDRKLKIAEKARARIIAMNACASNKENIPDTRIKERQEHSKENMQYRKKVVISRNGCKSKEVAAPKNDSLPSSKAIIKSMEGPVHRIGLPAFAQKFAESKDAHSDKLRSRSFFFFTEQAQNMKQTKVFVITASLTTGV